MTMRDELHLTAVQRRYLIREGARFRREQPRGAELADVAEHVAGILFDQPDRFGTADVEAIAISDYAYGVATFICPDTF